MAFIFVRPEHMISSRTLVRELDLGLGMIIFESAQCSFPRILVANCWSVMDGEPAFLTSSGKDADQTNASVEEVSSLILNAWDLSTATIKFGALCHEI